MQEKGEKKRGSRSRGGGNELRAEGSVGWIERRKGCMVG